MSNKEEKNEKNVISDVTSSSDMLSLDLGMDVEVIYTRLEATKISSDDPGILDPSFYRTKLNEVRASINTIQELYTKVLRAKTSAQTRLTSRETRFDILMSSSLENNVEVKSAATGDERKAMASNRLVDLKNAIRESKNEVECLKNLDKVLGVYSKGLSTISSDLKQQSKLVELELQHLPRVHPATGNDNMTSGTQSAEMFKNNISNIEKMYGMEAVEATATLEEEDSLEEESEEEVALEVDSSEMMNAFGNLTAEVTSGAFTKADGGGLVDLSEYGILAKDGGDPLPTLEPLEELSLPEEELSLPDEEPARSMDFPAEVSVTEALPVVEEAPAELELPEEASASSAELPAEGELELPAELELPGDSSSKDTEEVSFTEDAPLDLNFDEPMEETPAPSVKVQEVVSVSDSDEEHNTTSSMLDEMLIDDELTLPLGSSMNTPEEELDLTGMSLGGLTQDSPLSLEVGPDLVEVPEEVPSQEILPENYEMLSATATPAKISKEFISKEIPKEASKVTESRALDIPDIAHKGPSPEVKKEVAAPAATVPNTPKPSSVKETSMDDLLKELGIMS
jgi:hypothetical protein